MRLDVVQPSEENYQKSEAWLKDHDADLLNTRGVDVDRYGFLFLVKGD